MDNVLLSDVKDFLDILISISCHSGKAKSGIPLYPSRSRGHEKPK